jgi:hypothetical protein
VTPDTVLEKAFAALAAHRPGLDGYCLGCLATEAAELGRATIERQNAGVWQAAGERSPCLISRAATVVIETHGVQRWDGPGSRLPYLYGGQTRPGHLPGGI